MVANPTGRQGACTVHVVQVCHHVSQSRSQGENKSYKCVKINDQQILKLWKNVNKTLNLFVS